MQQPLGSVVRRFASSTAVRFSRYGNPSEVLKRETVELADKLGDSQVALRFLAAPINPADIAMVQGVYNFKPAFPAVGGIEGVALVEKVGPKVKNVAVNDWVIPTSPSVGTWADRRVVSADDLVAVSKEIPVEYAATLGVNPATAYRLLADFAQLKAGDVVLQNAANSTVGLAVIQLAAARKLKTVNIIRNRPDYAETVDTLKSLGADIVVNEEFVRSSDFSSLVADLPRPKLALNAVGGQSATELARQLAENGILVTYGSMANQPVTIPTSALIFKNINVRGFWLSRWLQEHPAAERKAMYDELGSLVKAGKLKLALERAKFSEFPQALERAQEPYRGRKVVMMMDQ